MKDNDRFYENKAWELLMNEIQETKRISEDTLQESRKTNGKVADLDKRLRKVEGWGKSKNSIPSWLLKSVFGILSTALGLIAFLIGKQ